MPQNTPFFTETNVGIGNFNVGAQLANLRGLNPFFGTRTLTLVDTRRVVPNSRGRRGRSHADPVDARRPHRGRHRRRVGRVRLGRHRGRRERDPRHQARWLQGAARLRRDDRTATAATRTARSRSAAASRQRQRALHRRRRVSEPGRRSDRARTTRDWCKESWSVGTNGGFNTPPESATACRTSSWRRTRSFRLSDTGLMTAFGGVAQQFNSAGTALLPYNPGQFPGVFSRIGGDGTLLAYSISNIRPDGRALLGARPRGPRLHRFAEVLRRGRARAQRRRQRPRERRPRPDRGLRDSRRTTPTSRRPSRPRCRVSRRQARSSRASSRPNVFSARNTTENTTLRFVTGLERQLRGSKWDWDALLPVRQEHNHQRLFHNMVGAFVPGRARV